MNKTRNGSVRPHQVSHRVTTFDALLRNNLNRFLRRCASSNFFIRSLQMSDAFYKSSFSLNYLTVLYDGDQLSWILQQRSCWCAVPVYALHQYYFCITTKILTCAALKFRKNLTASKFTIICLAGDVWYTRCKAFKTLSGTVCIPLCANVHPHLNSFYRLAVYLKVLMLERVHFSHITGSLVLWWMNDATVGVLLKWFALTSVVVCKYLFCYG